MESATPMTQASVPPAVAAPMMMAPMQMTPMQMTPMPVVSQIGGVLPTTATTATPAATLMPAAGLTLKIGWLSGLAFLVGLIFLIILSIYGLTCWFRRSARESELIAVTGEIEAAQRRLDQLRDEAEDYDS